MRNVIISYFMFLRKKRNVRSVSEISLTSEDVIHDLYENMLNARFIIFLTRDCLTCLISDLITIFYLFISLLV